MNQGRAWATFAIVAAVALAGCSAKTPPPIEGADAQPQHPLRNSSFSWDPYFPEVGQVVAFEPHVRSSAPGDEIRGFIWDFGDVQYTDSHPTYSFDTAGSHTVQLRIDTAKGGTWRVEQTVEVVGVSGEASSSTASSADPDAPATTPVRTEGPPPTILVEQQEADVNLSFRWSRPVDAIHWDFGDGETSNEPSVQHAYGAVGDYTITLRVSDGAIIGEATTTVTVASVPFQPHVIVGIPDTGINPYHEIYYRPALTEHPCTYIQDFPCSVQELPLTVGPGPSWGERFQQDQDVWRSIRPGTWYWIPQTVFVGVFCEPDYTRAEYRGDYCILDDAHMHGTGTTSSVLMENPDALIAFKDGGSSTAEIRSSGIPVDIVSVSWGSIVPIPVLGYDATRPIQVYSAGNDPRSTVIDSKGDPDIISVGGAYANGRSSEPLAANQPEVVSYFCRPTAQTRSISEMRDSYCGTSFSAPTVAGALSKVILELRKASGHTGGIDGPYVDPLLGVTKGELRSAMNRTASYDPEAKYDNSFLAGIPLNSAAPWVQWGWGFFDGWVADATVAHMLGTEAAPAKPDEAVLYMETLFLVKDATHPL